MPANKQLERTVTPRRWTRARPLNCGVIRCPGRVTVPRYDASTSPDAGGWHLLDEQKRLELVREYHRDIGEELPDERQNALHAAAHVIVENQLVLGISPVPDTLTRLMHEGLDRHAAVHAIGSVLMGSIYEGLSDSTGNITSEYTKRLGMLTARKWKRGTA